MSFPSLATSNISILAPFVKLTHKHIHTHSLSLSPQPPPLIFFILFFFFHIYIYLLPCQALSPAVPNINPLCTRYRLRNINPLCTRYRLRNHEVSDKIYYSYGCIFLVILGWRREMVTAALVRSVSVRGGVGALRAMACQVSDVIVAALFTSS